MLMDHVSIQHINYSLRGPQLSSNLKSLHVYTHLSSVHLSQPFDAASKNEIKIWFEDLLLNTLLQV
jgi:hypothetical protein